MNMMSRSTTNEEKLKSAFRMYDLDANGLIDKDEMEKVIHAIYDMLGQAICHEKAIEVFQCLNQDGYVTEEQFVNGCMADNEMSRMLFKLNK